ncbi:MAG: WGR domain-containing protein [Sulfuricurvum sp.]|nr:WGR domain-containing protein [Sulfuricurvum sp.]
MTTILYRTVNERERYYTIQLLPNLFGETLVIRSYGAKKNSKATRTIQEVYTNEAEAHNKVDVLIASKRKRGYHPFDHN